MGPIQRQIIELLQTHFKPHHLDVINESHLHSRHAGGESHFKVLIVSDAFQGVSRLDRQRRVNSVVQHFLNGSVHALTQRALSPEEWAAQNQQDAGFQSPECVTRNTKPRRE